MLVDCWVVLMVVMKACELVVKLDDSRVVMWVVVMVVMLDVELVVM